MSALDPKALDAAWMALRGSGGSLETAILRYLSCLDSTPPKGQAPLEGVTEAMVETACDAAYNVINKRAGVVFTSMGKKPAPADVREWMRAALEAALPPASGAVEAGGLQPTHWHCKDYADGWISFDNEAEALEYQRDTGCLLRVVYRPAAPTEGR